MHFLPCGNRANETARSSRAIGVCCTVTISVLSTTVVLGEWEGGRQAKVGENVRLWLQHMSALRPFLSIEAMIKMKMEPYETEAMGPLCAPFDHDSKPPILEMGKFYLKIA